jgi:maleylacetoacetate isomerase
MKLYNFSRSSASFRVRIALALKGLPYEYVSVKLQKNEHQTDGFKAISASRLVPVLEDGELRLSQSMATIEYLDETYPEPPLMPADALGRHRVRALAQDIACEIHPLNNLKVLRYLVHELKLPEETKDSWYRHWVETGLQTVDRQLAANPSAYCHGSTPTLADCVLVPQIFNAKRFNCRLDHVPQVMRVFEHCMNNAAFEAARPENCPDAV